MSRNPKPTIKNVKSSASSIGLQEKIKSDSYDASLKRIRERLNKNEKVFSRFLHAKGMDSLNDLLAKTLARPLCVIGGGIFALIGVGTGIFLAKFYGYSYNYLLLLIFYVIGYLAVLVVEAIVAFFVKYK